MARSQPNTLEERIELFLRRRRVATIAEICSAVDRAGITVKQALAKLDYLTSYDNNSRFYTLGSVARFDEHGIWRHRKASFTRHKTLANLLLALVDGSPRGYTSVELEGITGVRVRTALAELSKRARLVRTRRRGEYFYFTARSKRARSQQMRIRFGLTEQLEYEEDVPVQELKRTVTILLEIIRTQPSSQQELREQLSRVHPEIPRGLVGEVCRRYGIRLKKKLDAHRIFEEVAGLTEEFRRRSGEPLVLHFRPERTSCPECYRPLAYFKTTKARSFQTLRYGVVHFRESQTCCPKHRYRPEDGSAVIHGSEFLRSLVRPRAPIGYDVIVEIGKKRFIEFLQVDEVVRELGRQGISLSPSSVSRWADFFLAVVECLHSTRINKLKRLMRKNGGYLLHIDCTTETKADTVFVCMDRILGAVLLSEKIPSENGDEAKRHLQALKAHFGVPLAIMRDMSGPLGWAVEEVFPGVSDRICQFHFLRDIGRDLLGELHVRFGRELTQRKINTDLRRMKRELERSLPIEVLKKAASEVCGTNQVVGSTRVFREIEAVLALRLITWVFDSRRDGEGLGFPFDLPRLLFYSRLNKVRLRLARYSKRYPRTIASCLWMRELQRIVEQTKDAPLPAEVRELRARQRAFGRLRSVLRFQITKTAPLAETMSFETLKDVRAYNRGLLRYTKGLLAGRRRGELSEAEEIILTHVEKYRFKLPIPEDLAEVLLQGKLDRTNNAEESLFRDIKRAQRRQIGKKDISREFALYGPYLPLMKNLTNEHYVATVIGRMEDLPVRIGQLDPRDIAHYKEKLEESRRGKFFKYLKGIDGIRALSS